MTPMYPAMTRVVAAQQTLLTPVPEQRGLAGVKNMVTMLGTPGSGRVAKYPSWVVNPWNGVYMDVLDYRWGIAVEF
jgi:hypothetical protein